MEQLTELLLRGAAGLGLNLAPAQVDALKQHLALLERWNAKLNLVGPGTAASWAVAHTLDSLAVVPWIGVGDSVVDVGSGAGFPGVPCAITCPAATFALVEPRGNRAAFLQNVLAATGLRNAVVRNERAEGVAEGFRLVLGRAVAAADAWEMMASRLCGPGGGFALFTLADPPLLLGDSKRALVRSYTLEGGAPRFVAKYVPRGTIQAVS